MAGVMGCIGVACVCPLEAWLSHIVPLMFPQALSFLPDLSCVPFLLSFPGISSRVTM